jgi:hypothetical protein
MYATFMMHWKMTNCAMRNEVWSTHNGRYATAGGRPKQVKVEGSAKMRDAKRQQVGKFLHGMQREQYRFMPWNQPNSINRTGRRINIFMTSFAMDIGPSRKNLQKIESLTQSSNEF